MKKFSVSSVLSVIVPFAIAILVGTMWLVQDDRRKKLEVQELSLREKNSSLQSISRQLDVGLVANKTIADYATAEEQAEFLTQLRLKASTARVRLQRYENRGVLAPPRDPNKKEEVQLFRAVASLVEVEGSYEGCRQFSYSLLRDQRLMNMSGVTWKREPQDRTTVLSFMLVRYVTDPPPAPAVTAAVAARPVGEALQ